MDNPRPLARSVTPPRARPDAGEQHASTSWNTHDTRGHETQRIVEVGGSAASWESRSVEPLRQTHQQGERSLDDRENSSPSAAKKTKSAIMVAAPVAGRDQTGGRHGATVQLEPGMVPDAVMIVAQEVQEAVECQHAQFLARRMAMLPPAARPAADRGSPARDDPSASTETTKTSVVLPPPGGTCD
jgi:hypothetical protein